MLQPFTQGKQTLARSEGRRRRAALAYAAACSWHVAKPPDVEGIERLLA